ncbi:jg19330 [Pararge aegeria aegeria]|uniref:Jg19330 protein n=2 Tax=Pararge aegeria TaxID=116150 RepID=A0A8S4S6N4_9NEOP|nr:jg19330 [Pararge aegeria aegeria]
MYNLSQFIDLSLAHLPSHLAAQRFEPRKLPSLASCFLRRTVESCLKGYLRTCYILLQLCTFNSLQYTTFFVREPIT